MPGILMQNKTIFTASNFLSFARIFFIIPIVHYISVRDNITVLILMAIAIFTDLLDGYLARKLNQITMLGKILDPLADKILVIGGFIALSHFQNFPWWLTIIIVIRDLSIIIGSLVIFSQKKSVVSSNIPGKITVLVISSLALCQLLDLLFLILPFSILVLIMIIISAINYIIVFIRNVNKGE